VKAVALGLAIVGLLAGLWAARLWWRASRVEIVPTYIEHGRIEPVGGSQMDWILGTIKASNNSSRLNARAAIWTAVAIVLSTAASVVGLI
jgi:hypothetical protein